MVLVEMSEEDPARSPLQKGKLSQIKEKGIINKYARMVDVAWSRDLDTAATP